MGRNYYSEVIKELHDPVNDWRQIVIRIAQKHPKFVIDAIENKVNWEEKAKLLVDSNEKVAAIKFCREQTGMGLVEAKTAVEAL